jgi:O-antigen/teichoic acid export membrane protein
MRLAAGVVVQSPKIRSLTRILGANVVNNLISLSVTIVAARSLGPQQFGALSFAISLMTMLSLFLDFGFGVSLIRLLNKLDDPLERSDLIKAVLRWDGLLLAVAIALAYPLQQLLGRMLPVVSGAGWLLGCAIVTGGLLNIWTTIRTIDQARRDFRSFERFTYAYAGLRLVAAVSLPLIGISVLSVFAALYTAPLVILLLVNWLRRGVLFRPGALALRDQVVLLRRALSYGIWVFVSAISFTLLSRLPQLVLARLGSPTELGVYGAALTFLAGFSMFNDALRTVLLPEVASFTEAEQRRRFEDRLRKWGPIMLGTMVAALAAASLLQRFVLGAQYRESIPIFIVLGIGTVITIYIGIFNTLVHSYGVPKVEAIVNVLRVVALATLLFVAPKTSLATALAYAAVTIAGEAGLFAMIHKLGRSQ